MKKKNIKLFVIFIMICSTLILSGCAVDNNPGVFNGYDVYIKGVKTDVFECTIGEVAITPEDVVIKSSWTNESHNETIPISEFEVNVKWSDRWGSEETTIPDFWTNGTGSTENDCVSTYEFTLTKNEITVMFNVIVSNIIVKDCRVRIFDGNEYHYTTEMLWGHNDREMDPAKQFRLDIENLSDGYDQQEHMQWAFIKKDIYDSFETLEQKKEYITSDWKFAPGRETIPSDIVPGTYYVFAYVPSWNNRVYGEDGDSIVYDYATLTILPIKPYQEKIEHKLQHNLYEYSGDFQYYHATLRDEVKSIIEDTNFDCVPYLYIGGNWEKIDSAFYETIKVHAVKIDGEYKMVDLKEFSISKSEWVFINEDGTHGDVLEDNTQIEVVDYSEISQYINGKSITISVYYMIDDTFVGTHFDCSEMFKTEVTIKKYLVNLVPHVEAGSHKNVIARDTFEFSYGEVYDNGNAVLNIQDIMLNVFPPSNEYVFEGFDQTEYSTEPYYGYVKLKSSNMAWKLDGVNYTSEPLIITYYIN